jgi:hypothetical protein
MGSCIIQAFAVLLAAVCVACSLGVVVQYMALLQQQYPHMPLHHLQHLEQQIQSSLQQLANTQAYMQKPTLGNCHSSTPIAAAEGGAAGGCSAEEGSTEHYSTGLLRSLFDRSWINKLWHAVATVSFGLLLSSLCTKSMRILFSESGKLLLLLLCDLLPMSLRKEGGGG